MDDAPVRRSLRVAGMTPLRPMSGIMFQEENRSRSRSRSRTGTPSKGRGGSIGRSTLSTTVDSRQRQAMNLPSDISTSDFLGDTPTARFHRINDPPPAITNTVLARRIGINPLTAAVTTVKARRVQQHQQQHQNGSGNVFLNGNESEGSNLFILSTLRILGWIVGGIKLVGNFIVALANGPVKKTSSPPSWTRILSALALLSSSFIVLFSMSQLDWKLAMQVGSSIFSNNTPANPSTSSRPKHSTKEVYRTAPSSKDDFKNQIVNLEAAINEARALIINTDEAYRSIFDQTQVKLSMLEENDQVLQGRLNSLLSTADEIKTQLDDKVSFSEFKHLSSNVHELHGKGDQIKSQISDLKRNVSPENISIIARKEFLSQDQSSSLLRRNADGSIFLDPSLSSLLQELFADNITLIAGDSINSSPSTSHSTTSLNINAIEKLINGRMQSLEEKVYDKDHVSKLISDSIASELAIIRQISFNDKESLERSILQKLAILESEVNSQLISPEQIERVVHKEVLYKASKMDDTVQMADYALESMGARVVMSATSPSYNPTLDNNGMLSFLFGRSVGKSPRVALSPDDSLGNCWPIKGHTGALTIALANPIIPTHFSIDHIPGSLKIDRSSAPRKFSVYSMSSLRDEPYLLGSFEYSLQGPAVQTFPTQITSQIPVRFIRLVIQSNHGRPEFTCLYRFRVHSTQNTKDVFNDTQ